MRREARPAHLHLVAAAARDDEDALDQVFAALADPVRRSILSLLDGQELLVSQIAQHFDISLQAVSKHIQVLVRGRCVAPGGGRGGRADQPAEPARRGGRSAPPPPQTPPTANLARRRPPGAPPPRGTPPGADERRPAASATIGPAHAKPPVTS